MRTISPDIVTAVFRAMLRGEVRKRIAHQYGVSLSMIASIGTGQRGQDPVAALIFNATLVTLAFTPEAT